MKKLMLAAAVLLGAVAGSQAGVDVHVGFGLPFPPLPFPHHGRVVISHPAPVVVAEAPVCAPAPPPCHERVVVVPRCEPYPRHYSYYGRGYGYGYGHRYGYRGYDHRGWDRHDYRY